VRESSLCDVDETKVLINDGPADLDRFKSAFLLVDENFTFIESCFAQLFERNGLVFKCLTIFSVEFVLEDFRLGGGGGTTGTKDLTVLGNGPNMSRGREIFVIG
jgi:hypothetical protein